MGMFGFLKIAFPLSKQLPEEEEIKLVLKYQSGDTKAYNKLRLSLRPLIKKVVNDVSPSGNQISSSNLLLRADSELRNILLSFDPNKGVKLKTHVTGQLRGRLRNATSENKIGPYVPRNQHSDLDKYNKAVLNAEVEFGRNPSEDQIRLFYNQAGASKSFDEIKQYHARSYLGDATFGEDEESDGVRFKDQFLEGDIINDEDLFSSIEEEEKDRLVAQNFQPNEQRIIQLIIKEGKSFVETALSLGISTGEVRKVIRRWHKLTQNER